MRKGLFALAFGIAGCTAILGVDGVVTQGEGDAGAGDGPGSAPDTGIGAADAAGDAPPSCPPGANFDSDPKNCGVCGHDCLGGMCGAGFCQPVLFLDGRNDVISLVADDGTIYWSESQYNATVLACPATGCTTAGAIAVSEGYSQAVAFDDAFVYWSSSNENGSMRRAGRDGGGVETVLSDIGAGAFALDSENVYVATSLGQGGEILRALKDGGGRTSLAAAGSVIGIAVNADRLYYATSSFFQGSSVQDCALPACDGGGVSVADASDPAIDQPTSLTLSDAFVVWTSSPTFPPGLVADCPLSGCSGAVSVLAEKQDAPKSAVILGTTLAWAAGDHIFVCELPTCAIVQHIASPLPQPDTLALTRRAIYWSTPHRDLDGGTDPAKIWRLAR